MSAASAYERLLDALHEHGSTVRGNGIAASAQCPSHADRTPSLSLRRIEGSVLLHCHAACEVDDVLAALRLSRRDLFDNPVGATYHYTDQVGTVLRTVHRSPDKQFHQSGQTKGTATLYRLPQVVEAVATKTVVFVTEGEKDVHALESLGAVATCSPQGASNAARADWTPLHGGHVVLVPDRDEAGQRYIRDVVAQLDGKAATVRVKLPATGKDAADHVGAGHGLGELVPAELAVARDGATPLDTQEFGDGESAEPTMPPPSDPMAVARKLLEFDMSDGVLTLRHWRGGWMRWQRTNWVEVEPSEIKATAYKRLENASYVSTNPKMLGLLPWEPTRYKMGNVIEALAAVAYLSETVDAPSWLIETPQPGSVVRDGPRSEPLCIAEELVACTNGLLHVETRKLLDLTPAFFNRVAVPFDYDPDAPEPARWLRFLDELWPDDPDSIAALQEYFGYVLSGRTDLHKILLLIGPTRSGKGTIARVLAALVGKGNAAGPTLASLGTNFGLSPLLGKPLAVVSDARLGGANTHQVVERLLSVSGEDMLTVDRKYREPWTGKLPTRFLVLSNELPRFGDASGAIAHRFIVTALHRSFLGRENTRLTSELLTELPGILRWTLDGLDRLSVASSFTEPASSVDAITALQDLVSPIAAFVRDVCTVGMGHEVTVVDLYAAWKGWAEDNGHKAGSVQTLGRDLRAVVPQLRQQRPREGGARERRYLGLSLSAAHNGSDRGPSRTSTEPDPDMSESEPVVRDGPRPNASCDVQEPTATKCVHGVEAGGEPDAFVGGRLRCTECRAGALSQITIPSDPTALDPDALLDPLPDSAAHAHRHTEKGGAGGA